MQSYDYCTHRHLGDGNVVEGAMVAAFALSAFHAARPGPHAHHLLQCGHHEPHARVHPPLPSSVILRPFRMNLDLC